MKKSDLKTGMRIETRNGDFHIYYKKEGKLIDKEGGICWISDYNEKFEDNLIYKNEWDIMKIYDIPRDTDFIFDFNKKGTLLWKRKEEIILTLDGVEYSESTLRSLIKKATK